MGLRDLTLALDRQPVRTLRWGRFDDPPAHVSGKVMICGHTPQKRGVPRNLGHAICIDTRAWHPKGWLTCLDPSSGQLWQANNAGKTRSAKL